MAARRRRSEARACLRTRPTPAPGDLLMKAMERAARPAQGAAGLLAGRRAPVQTLTLALGAGPQAVAPLADAAAFVAACPHFDVVGASQPCSAASCALVSLLALPQSRQRPLQRLAGVHPSKLVACEFARLP